MIIIIINIVPVYNNNNNIVLLLGASLKKTPDTRRFMDGRDPSRCYRRRDFRPCVTCVGFRREFGSFR